MEAGKARDAYGLMPAHTVECSGAPQAYIQCELKGFPTWVALPPPHFKFPSVGDICTNPFVA